MNDSKYLILNTPELWAIYGDIPCLDRRQAWLEIAKVPVQYPAWLLHEDGVTRKWFDCGGGEAEITEWVAWQPADPAPDAPQDEDEQALRSFLDDPSKPAKGDLAIFKAGRDYEKRLH
jgi:hypothetical protein